MAEQERLTNRERRTRSREERRRHEEEAARRKQQGRLKGGLVTFAIVAVVGAVVFQAFAGGPTTIDDTLLIASSDAEAARQAAGCEVLVEREPLAERRHLPQDASRDLGLLYPDVRPTHSGPHYERVHPVIADSSRQIDEFTSTHNLEHGSIIVWWDPDSAGAFASDIGSWAETLNASGFRRDAGGIGIMTSPYDDPGLSSGRAVAFRAWGTAMDCDTWDETVAHAFVIDNFGTHGIGPERLAAPYPTDVLAYEDRQVDDSDAPIDGQSPEPEVADEEELDLGEDVTGQGEPDEDDGPTEP